MIKPLQTNRIFNFKERLIYFKTVVFKGSSPKMPTSFSLSKSLKAKNWPLNKKNKTKTNQKSESWSNIASVVSRSGELQRMCVELGELICVTTTFSSLAGFTTSGCGCAEGYHSNSVYYLISGFIPVVQSQKNIAENGISITERCRILLLFGVTHRFE